ncbi:MAG: hypothetical protein K6E40_06600 [Desulfovibrio sp.]|nr:hypothetical protein [Desulfovibrio sp.]
MWAKRKARSTAPSPSLASCRTVWSAVCAVASPVAFQTSARVAFACTAIGKATFARASKVFMASPWTACLSASVGQGALEPSTSPEWQWR